MKTMYYFAVAILAAALCYSCGGNNSVSDETTADTTAAMQEPRATVVLEEAWSTDTVMRTPESVLFDADNQVLYVSNINNFDQDNKDGDGFITKLSPDGSVEELQWVSGLNDPKGMGIYNGMLYVADLDEIVEIDLESGEVENKYAVEGARFLNDITVDDSGKIYISDSETDKIHVLEDGTVTTLMSDSTLQRPNGLLVTDDGELMLASAGGGFFAPIDTAAKAVEAHMVENIPSADGIVQLSDGNFLVSTWSGEVHYVEAGTGTSQKLLDTKAEEINSADIGYDDDRSMLLVPTFNDNRVVAYKIVKENS